MILRASQLHSSYPALREVHFIDADSVYIDDECLKNGGIGKGTTLWPNVYIVGKTSLGKNCEVLPGAFIDNATIHDNAEIGLFLVIRRCTIGSYAKIPYHTELADTVVGEYTNIARNVTVSNFDGIEKHKTFIGNGCFIGTDVNIMPPITIGNEVRVFPKIRLAAKEPIPDHAFVIPEIRNGRESIKILKNSSFKLPHDFCWIWSKQPMTPHYVKEFFARGYEVFDSRLNSCFVLWLTASLKVLNQQTPVELIKSEGEEGIRKLMDILGRIEHGVFS